MNINMTGVFVNSFCINIFCFRWILDSCATDHMVFDLNMFNIKDVLNSALPVNLPNWSIVLVKFISSC